MDLGITVHFSVFPHDPAALRNLGFVIKTDWSAICTLCLLRTLAVGRWQQSESIEVALDMD